VLLEKGADPDLVPSGGGVSALAKAVETEDVDMVRVLLEGGADPAGKPWGGDGALTVAVKKGNEGILRPFLHGRGRGDG
jgi:ankyrin repeat protein